MKILPGVLIGCLALVVEAGAEVGPVAVRMPAVTAWVGQRVPLSVELRASGSFAGTATFELPSLPGTLLIKIGTPVVGSQEIDGESWLVQTHEFALFSQRPGLLEVPPFTVRFAHHDGFTGPVREVQAQAPGVQVEIRQPPGSERTGYLLTTDSFAVTEIWEPQPGPVQVGTMFKRTIVQRASNLSGMALEPAPAIAAEGLRVYPGEAETKDTTERGAFIGERRETLTYLVTQPGTRTLPALTYTWWNPKTEQLQVKPLAAVTFEAAPAATAADAATAAPLRSRWPWLLLAVFVGIIGVWQRRRVMRWQRRCLEILHPPDRAAARQLLAACRRHDAAAAETAWFAWLTTREATFQPGPELQAATRELHRQLYGPSPAVQRQVWRGDALGRALEKFLAARNDRSTNKTARVLPVLNP